MRAQLVKACVLHDRVVEYTLSDGRKIQRDFSLVTGGVFNTRKWTDLKNFAKARVVGGEPCWPGELDFCPDVILRGGIKGRVPAFAFVGNGKLLSRRAGEEQMWNRNRTLSSGRTTPKVMSAKKNFRAKLVDTALDWEKRFGVAPSITSALSEFDAAICLGHTPESFALQAVGRTAVSRGHDFVFHGLRYQVKANRPSGKPGSIVTLVAKVKNYDWDRLIWILYNPRFQIVEAWLWSVDDYRRQFASIDRLSPKHMRGGTRMTDNVQG
jgi:hypothetical protein